MIGPQIAFVDDIQGDIALLENAAQTLHAGTIYFNAAPESSEFPDKPLETVEVLFLDLYYSSSFDAEVSAQWVESIIAPNSNYTLIVWSKDTHEVNQLLRVLDGLDLTPAHFEAWQKTDFDLKKTDFTEKISHLFSSISNKAPYTVDRIWGQVIEVHPNEVYINCLLNEQQPTFQQRRFDTKLLGNLENLEPGMFVKIIIYSKPGARRIDILEEKKDLTQLFEQPDFFKGLEGNSFFIAG